MFSFVLTLFVTGSDHKILGAASLIRGRCADPSRGGQLSKLELVSCECVDGELATILDR